MKPRAFATFTALVFILPPAFAAETVFYKERGPGTLFFGFAYEPFVKPVLADLDGDSDTDLLLVTSDGDGDGQVLEFYRNTGTATAPVFVPQTWTAINSVSVPLTPGDSLCAADLDADGDKDLAVATPNGTVRYYRNTGSAAAPVFTLQSAAASPFPAAGIAAASSYPALTAGDVDQDGDVDLVMADNSTSVLALLRNTGTPAAPLFVRENAPPFSNITSPDNAFLFPALTDSDGDGDLDLIVGLDDDAPLDDRLRYYRNTGTPAAPAFTLDLSPLPFRTLDGSVKPAVADLNADGHPDLLCAVSESSLFLMRGAAPQPARYAEVTGAAHPVPTATLRHEGSTADLDNDGDEDLVVSENAAGNLVFLRNTGTATAPAWSAWGGPSPAPALSGVYDTELADLDADNDFDLLLRFGPIFHYFRNNGTATVPAFAELTGTNNPFAAISARYSPSFADLDGDGDLDLAAGSLYYENTGTRFAPVFTERTGAANPLPNLLWTNDPFPELADLDGDGGHDLTITTHGELLYYENTGGSPRFTHRTGPDSPFAAFNGVSYITGLRIGEWKDGAPTDLMFTVLDGPAPVGIRFYTGLRPPGLSYVEWSLMWFGSYANPSDDWDIDGHENLVEYALDLNPYQASIIPCTVSRTPAGVLQVSVVVRTGDPVLDALQGFGESSPDLTAFSGHYAPAVTDPTPGDGFVRWTFTDEPPAGTNPRRFLRAVFE